MFRITNNRGVPFNVRLVRTGERFGRNYCLLNHGESMVEFYDARFDDPDFNGCGQLVSSYYVSTILERDSCVRGLDLCGYVDDWKVTAENMNQVRLWLMLEIAS